MADDVSLEFLQRQQLDILKEIRALREDSAAMREDFSEIKAIRDDFAKSFRLMTDTQISIGRTLSALDRRLSEVKDDLETTIRMELVGHRNVTVDLVDKAWEQREAELIQTMTELFDKRYAPRGPTESH